MVVAEAPAERPESAIVCTVIDDESSLRPRLAIDTDLTWHPGQAITISFMDGTQKQIQMTIDSAEELRDYANIDFEWMTDPERQSDGNVRVSFNPAQGAWSYLGDYAMTVPNEYPTMNLGFRENHPPWDVDRIVKHEFGHMLGAIHEHQRPDNGIQWNKQAVYDWYRGAMNWSPDMVDANIFATYDGDLTNSVFDPDSIMMYSINNAWTLDDFSTGTNSKLSHRDMDFFQEVYPFEERRYTPYWPDAPEWANWWAVESNGIAWWWQKKPQLEGTLFLPRCGYTPVFDRKIIGAGSWYTESLRKRPGYLEDDEECSDSSTIYIPVVMK